MSRFLLTAAVLVALAGCGGAPHSEPRVVDPGDPKLKRIGAGESDKGKGGDSPKPAPKAGETVDAN